MTGFSVNLGALQAMQAQLRRAVDDVSAIRQHFGKIDDSAFSGAILGALRGKFDAVLRAQISSAVDAQSAAQNAANQIQASGQYYSETDQADAAQFDATLPASPGTTINMDPQSMDKPAGAYQDVTYPKGRLNEPPSYDDEMTWKLTLQSDLGNVVSFVRDMIKLVLGVDPIGAVEELIAGDWKEVRRISDRFNNNAWAFYDCCDNIYTCANSSTGDWVGNTGDSVRNYLLTLASGFHSEYEKNEYVAEQLKSLAEGVFDALNVLTDLLSDWVNAKLIPAMASIGIAASTEEIPLVDVFTDAVAGYTGWEAFQAGLEVYEKANKIKAFIEGFASELNIINGQVQLPSGPETADPIPSDTYSSPVGY
jgi:hypothetical protein